MAATGDKTRLGSQFLSDQPHQRSSVASSPPTLHPFESIPVIPVQSQTNEEAWTLISLKDVESSSYHQTASNDGPPRLLTLQTISNAPFLSLAGQLCKCARSSTKGATCTILYQFACPFLPKLLINDANIPLNLNDNKYTPLRSCNANQKKAQAAGDPNTSGRLTEH